MTPTSRRHPSLAAVLKLADRQHGLVTRAQLLDAGLSPEAIKHRLRRGRLHRAYRGVFAVGHPRLTQEGRWLAAVLACGPGAVLSHLSAAVLWAIWERGEPARPQVSVPTDDGRRGPREVEVHRASTLRPDQATERDGIPVTTLPRTLSDVAGILDDRRLRSVLRQSERVHRLDLRDLRASLDALPGSAPGPARLRRTLDAYVPGAGGTESDAEAAFLDLCARHGLPLPEPQFPIGRYRADFAWPDRSLVVEIDDRGSHDGYVAFREDRVRDRTLKAAGFDVLRFTRTEVLTEPVRVALEVRSALAATPRRPPHR